MEDAAYACRVIRLLGAKTMIVTNAAGAGGITLDPDPADHEGFEAYTRRFTQALEAERAAVSHLK